MSEANPFDLDPVVAPEPIKHNWLYSVVPTFIDPNGIYLVAYCKNDRKYATVRLHIDGMEDYVVQGKANIPVFGCEPQE